MDISGEESEASVIENMTFVNRCSTNNRQGLQSFLVGRLCVFGAMPIPNACATEISRISNLSGPVFGDVRLGQPLHPCGH
jgi:hypothetical protein